MVEVWRPRSSFHVLTEIAELFEFPTDTDANMAMLRSGGDLEATGFLTIIGHSCDISSKQNYSNRLHSRDLIVLGLIKLLWLSEDRYKILTIFRTSSFNASEYVDHNIQI